MTSSSSTPISQHRDGNIDLQIILQQYFYLFIFIFFIVIGSSCWLKYIFGTFSFRTAGQRWKENMKSSKRYQELFNTRNTIMYHISWAKSRGDLDEARQLMRELTKIDKVITLLTGC